MATATTRADLAMLLPELFKDPDRILIDGPAKVDTALTHYLDELKLSMTSNVDILESVELAVERLQDDTPKISQQIELLATTTKNILEKNSESARLLRQHLLELMFNEKALLALNLSSICRNKINTDIDAVRASTQLIRSQSALLQLHEIVGPDDRELKELTTLVGCNAAMVANSIILGGTLFEYVKFSKQTLSLDKKKSHLMTAFNQSVAILSAPDADVIYSKLKVMFWNEFFSPILGGIFIEVRCSSSERLDVFKIRRTILHTFNQFGHDFAILRLRAIESVIKIMFENVFDACQATLCHLGRHIWPELSTAVVQQVLRPSVPSYYNSVDEFRLAMQPAILSFVAALRRYHFLPELGRTPLEIFLENLDSVFGEIISTRFVARARSLMTDSKFTLWSPESKFKFDDLSEESRMTSRQITIEFTQENPGVKITSNAAECALLVHFLLEQANTNVPVELSSDFRNAARAILFVFESVSPVYHEKLFSSEPSIRCLYAINCLLLSHHMARAVIIYNLPDFLKICDSLARAARVALQSQRQWLLSSANHVRLRDKQIDALDVLNVLYKSWR